MELAEVAAKRSHDAETKVGGILVRNDTGAVIATAFNGFLRKANDNNLPNKRPEKYKYIQHCELNLVAHCAMHGISTLNTTLYCTLTPCVKCTRMLWQCGVHTVVAKTAYTDFYSEVITMQDMKLIYHANEHGFLEISYEAL